MMTSKPYRLPAEWQQQSAVLLSWPHQATDWAYMIDAVTQCYVNVARALSEHCRLIIVAPDASEVANTLKGFVATDRYTVVEMPTNDTWARDFGMISVSGDDGKWKIYDYKFNGWGLKFAANFDNLINRNIVSSGIIRAEAEYVNRLGFVLEGGSIDIDDHGVLMTTTECLMSPNRNGDMTKDEIERRLINDLGCEKVLWIDHGALAGDDTDSHIDTLARFLPGNIIAYSACDRADDEHYEELSKMEAQLRQVTNAYGQPYQLIALPIPEAIYDEEGQRLPATYANFLIVNGVVFMPVYGDDKYDRIAIDSIKRALPAYKVVPIDCVPLIQQHGSLHCITMQIPTSALL